jgi:hypothetical protein
MALVCVCVSECRPDARSSSSSIRSVVSLETRVSCACMAAAAALHLHPQGCQHALPNSAVALFACACLAACTGRDGDGIIWPHDTFIGA